MARKIDFSCDDDLLRPYHEEANRTDFVKVKRVVVKDRDEAIEYDTNKEKIPGCIHVYFVEGKERPVAWTNDFKLPYMYFYQ